MNAERTNHLYAIMWPNHALVASQLDPEEFGRHYGTGSSRYFQGLVIFAEIDPSYRHDYFRIDEMMERMEEDAKASGRAKRTKFISNYRVLEHIELAAYHNMYLTSVEGEVLELQQTAFESGPKSDEISVYQEICPMSAVVLSKRDPAEFGDYITDPEQPKAAPKVLFTKIRLNEKDFLERIERNPFYPSPLPNVHPQKLREQIEEFLEVPAKRTKGIALDAALNDVTFSQLEGGIWLAGDRQIIFYPYPDKETLERDHYSFIRSVRRGY